MKVLTNISEILSSAFKGAVKGATENASDWLKKWRENLQPITEQRSNNSLKGFTKLVFDNQFIFHRLKHFGSVIYTKSNFDRGLGKNLYIQISSLVGYFKKANAYLAFFIRFNETVHDKWCLHKSVGQTDNGLECVFDKHWLNSV